MFWNKKVKVRLLDADSGREMARTEFTPEQLPESFGARTTLNLAGIDWEVVSADPVRRADYVQRRELVLRLRKLEHVAPNDILFSLPTICDGLPALSPRTAGREGRVLELHEDDWRQVELVTRSHEDAIHAELSAIRRIYAEQRTPSGGFRELHVRASIPEPLTTHALTLDAIRQTFAVQLVPFEALRFEGAAGEVAGGFAFESPSGLSMYGTASDAVTTLGLARMPHAAEASADAKALQDLMHEHDLLLVDWCSPLALRSTDDVGAYLRGRA